MKRKYDNTVFTQPHMYPLAPLAGTCVTTPTTPLCTWARVTPPSSMCLLLENPTAARTWVKLFGPLYWRCLNCWKVIQNTMSTAITSISTSTTTKDCLATTMKSFKINQSFYYKVWSVQLLRQALKIFLKKATLTCRWWWLSLVNHELQEIMAYISHFLSWTGAQFGAFNCKSICRFSELLKHFTKFCWKQPTDYSLM